MSRALLLLLAGAAGGTLAWIISEPSSPGVYAARDWDRWSAFFSVVTGISIGGLIGGVSGWFQGTKTHLAKGALYGFVVGAVAGPLGYSIGNSIYSALGGEASPIRLVARSLGWSLFGGILGIAEGLVGRSTRRGFQGMVGGLLGGAIGGLAFEITSTTLGPAQIAIGGGNESGTYSRLVGLICTGAGIGLLIGIVEALTRQAWVRVLLGRNEGKDYPLDAVQSWIGRSENAHVPLFGDDNIVPAHASIVRQGGSYVLYDHGSPIGVGVNGMRVQQALLQPGDLIQVASFNLQFMTKGARPARTATPQRFEPSSLPNMPQGVPVGPTAPTMQATTVFSTGQPTVMAQPMSQPAGQAAVLLATSGPIAGQRVEIRRTLEVGREGSGLALTFDSMASRRHANFAVGPSGLSVTDLGSTNGTTVNGQKISTSSLKMGDIVQIGLTQFRVEVAP
ncbi:MAG: hypothetical protein HONBIEJF_01962 [Fimbriimonadaceae bacterium]|nr:hypothetical protein [Fimbriimonadaceae bacterium]